MAKPFNLIAARYQLPCAESAIRSACRELVIATNQSFGPVALKPILELIGIDFRWQDEYKVARSDGASAVLISDETGQLKIEINKNQLDRYWTQTRFSIAHEIVHALIYKILQCPELISELTDSDDTYRRLERLCDIGASEILIPKRRLRLEIERKPINGARVLELQRLFKVSRSAMLWRLAEFFPNHSVIVWNRYASREGEEPTIRVESCFPGYEKSGKRVWLPKGATRKHMILDSHDMEQIYDDQCREPITCKGSVLLGKQVHLGECLVFSSVLRATHPDLFNDAVGPNRKGKRLIMFFGNPKIDHRFKLCNKENLG